MDLNSNKKNYRTEENNLLGLLASNPKQGFSDLYDKYAASLYGVILKNVPDTDKACDILRDVFLEFRKQGYGTEKARERIFLRLLKILQRLSTKE
jgi:RNA polymerase sigma-70 factor (ECF subfamily)